MEKVKNDKKMTISSFLKEVKPVKNLQEELDRKNPLYKHPIYIRIMRERGLIK
ncbi:MAG: hypothetical protein ACI35W_04960 [Anaeroplasmataceae bacterium]